MRVKIKNLTSSPYQLVNAKGEKIMLPANGELTDFEPHPMQISRYRSLGYFEITDSPAKKPKKSGKDPVAERTQAQKDGKDGGGKK